MTFQKGDCQPTTAAAKNEAGIDIKFFASSDNVSEETGESVYRWPLCYAHGAAEELITEVQAAAAWPFEPTDIFISDVDFPEEDGEYKGTLYGMDCVCVVATIDNTRHSRLVLTPIDDSDLKMARTPKGWIL